MSAILVCEAVVAFSQEIGNFLILFVHVLACVQLAVAGVRFTSPMKVRKTKRAPPLVLKTVRASEDIVRGVGRLCRWLSGYAGW